MNRRLYKSETDRVIGGVAGGVAEYLDMDPAIVRVLWALLALITGGIFFVLYIVMWIVVPYGPVGDEAAAAGGEATPEGAPPTWNALPARRARHRGSGSGSWIFGLILVIVGFYFLAREYLPDINLDRLWPFGLVLVGLVLLFGAMRRRPA